MEIPESSHNLRSLASDDGFSSDEELLLAKNCSTSVMRDRKQSQEKVLKKAYKDRSLQVTPTLKQLSVIDKSTITDGARRFDKRCGSPLLTRNKEIQVDAETKVKSCLDQMSKQYATNMLCSYTLRSS